MPVYIVYHFRYRQGLIEGTPARRGDIPVLIRRMRALPNNTKSPTLVRGVTGKHWSYKPFCYRNESIKACKTCPTKPAKILNEGGG